MSTLAKKPVTAEELLELPSGGYRYELFRGELRQMTPAGRKHGFIAMALGSRLENYVREKGSGEVYAAETGFKLRADPDTVRAPDVAFLSSERVGSQSDEGYAEGAPDLAVEVVSPSDRPAEVVEKVYEWLYHGCQEVWVVDPKQKRVSVYRSGEVLRTLSEADTLTSSLFPDWSLPLGELFV